MIKLKLLALNILTLCENWICKNNILLAAKTGNILELQRLVESEALVNYFDEQNRSALHFAAQEGHFDAVEILLKSGAKMTADIVGETPLHYAAHSNNPNVALALLKSGADPHIRDHYNNTALDKAIGKQNHAVQAILEKSTKYS